MNTIKKFSLIILLVISGLVFFTNTCFATSATVNTDTLKLRKEASTDSTVLDLLNQGQKLEIIEETGDWYKVNIKGMTGYVSKNYIKLEESIEQQTNNQSQEIIQSNNNEIDSNVTNTENTTSENTQTNDEKSANTIINTQITLSSDTKVYILPLINSSIISNLKKDSKVTVISKTNSWIYIQTDDMSGWIINEELQENSNNTTSAVPEANNTTASEEQTSIGENQNNEDNADTAISEKTLYVNTSSIYIRKGPGTNYEVVDSLIKNAQVIATAENGDWYKVKVNGQTGYIAKRLLSNTKQEDTTSRGDVERQENQNTNKETATVENNTETQTTSKGQQIANFAKQYLGCKYVYGASGPSTFDCSGFTMYVYKNFGVSLSHSAIAQSKNGNYVAKEDLQVGDLVFFKDYPSMDGIGHCGIYIGDGNFIHASSGTGYCVKISTLLSGSYNTRYDTARRIV